MLDHLNIYLKFDGTKLLVGFFKKWSFKKEERNYRSKKDVWEPADEHLGEKGSQDPRVDVPRFGTSSTKEKIWHSGRFNFALLVVEAYKPHYYF